MENKTEAAELEQSYKVTKHRKICKEMNETYDKKNQDYGDSFSKSWNEYGPVMLSIRLEDKLNRFKNFCKARTVNVKSESIRDTLLDLANYAIMGVMEIDAQCQEEIKPSQKGATSGRM